MENKKLWVVSIVIVALALVSGLLWWQGKQAVVPTPVAVVTQVEEAPASVVNRDDEAQAPAGDFTVDYGTESKYTREELDAAIGVIMDEFNTWEGCVMHSLAYDAELSRAAETEVYVKELNPGVEYVDAVVFRSSFHSPVDVPEVSAWEPDMEYENWSWYLARTQGGAWELLTWGY